MFDLVYLAIFIAGATGLGYSSSRITSNSVGSATRNSRLSLVTSTTLLCHGPPLRRTFNRLPFSTTGRAIESCVPVHRSVVKLNTSRIGTSHRLVAVFATADPRCWAFNPRTGHYGSNLKSGVIQAGVSPRAKITAPITPTLWARCRSIDPPVVKTSSTMRVW